jgi:tRNA threonylcarbamoyl adenosine modification protein (Sua5/YciO/YrdC/YwlC family)
MASLAAEQPAPYVTRFRSMKAVHLRVHPTHPQPRLLAQAAVVLGRGGVIVMPTDACYALACRIGNKAAEDRIRAIRHIERDHHFTLLCRDVSEMALYARVDNDAFRLVKTLAPGPYTFILPATKETPRRLLDPKRRTVGLRIVAHPFVEGLLEHIGEPLISSTLIDDALGTPYADPDAMAAAVGHAVEAIVDAGAVGIEMTTIIDLTGGEPRLVRQGRGNVAHVVVAQ